MKFTFERIKISCVDLKDTTYLISTETDYTKLAVSIQHIGLLSLPILKKNPQGNYFILSGFRRIAACRFLGFKYIESRVIDQEHSGLDCLKVAICDNTQTRQLNIIEQSRAIDKLNFFFERDDALITVEARKLGLNVNPGLIKKLKIVLQGHDEVIKLLASDEISLTIGLELNKLEKQYAESFAVIFKELRPTFNQQKEILVMTSDIALAGDFNLQQVLDRLVSIFNIDPIKLNRNQKIYEILRILKQIRFPGIATHENKYAEWVNQIKFPETFKLTPPSHFEGSRYSISFSFDSINMFESMLQFLSELKSKPVFTKILNKEFEDI